MLSVPFELSRFRYEGGVNRCSDVLDAEGFLFNAELDVVSLRAELHTAFAQLYKGVGSRWH